MSKSLNNSNCDERSPDPDTFLGVIEQLLDGIDGYECEHDDDL